MRVARLRSCSLLAALCVTTPAGGRAQPPVLEAAPATTSEVEPLVLHELVLFRLPGRGQHDPGLPSELVDAAQLLGVGGPTLGHLPEVSPELLTPEAATGGTDETGRAAAPEAGDRISPPGAGLLAASFFQVLLPHSRRSALLDLTLDLADGHVLAHVPEATRNAPLTARRPSASPSAPAGATPLGGSDSLVWRGRVMPRASRLTSVGSDRFWTGLRAASRGGIVVLRQRERFIYVEGVTGLDPVFSLNAAGASDQLTLIAETLQEQRAWLVDLGRFDRLRALPVTRARGRDPQGGAARESSGDLGQLRRELEGELIARGLDAHEATRLVEAFRGPLFDQPRRRLIYFLPRPQHDRALRLGLAGAPAELVRVGMVVHDL